MKRGNSRCPSAFDLIARVLAERLERVEPSDGLRAMFAASYATPWEDVVARARGELVLPALGAAVRDLDLLGSLEPRMRALLAIAHPANVDRNRKLREQLAAVVGVLNRAGIEPVLLKGAIRLVDGLYPDSGWRAMRDLDILVPEAGFVDAIEALGDAGYRLARAVEPTRKEALLRREGCSLPLEIHRELFLTARRQRLLRGSEVIAESRPAALAGVRARLPSDEHQLVHLIGHSQIGHRGHAYGRIMLRDRLEAAALLRWLPESIEWPAVFGRFEAANYRRPLLVFLLSLSDGGFYSMPMPGRIDALTAIQRRRIALQARSVAMTRVSLHTVWYAVLLKIQFLEHDAGWPRALETARKFLLDREERQRIAEMLVRGGPRPW
ncbi:MAG TPA: nucleotidyltransferase family protein [Woeseiaceae bacterium]